MKKSIAARAHPSRKAAALVVVSLVLIIPTAGRGAAGSADEIHYTFTGPTSVVFDWRGAATDIQFGSTTSYGNTATARAASPAPISSAGPFQEVELSGLQAGTTYHYSIGGGSDRTFTTAPTGDFRFDVTADVGSSRDYPNVATLESEIAADNPAFVLMAGDLTYANPFGQASVDQHFNDVMTWSQTAAYMPAWGNREWEAANTDDLRNYKGRFAIPNSQASAGAPSLGCCGEDWGWFDAGGVRFVSYPEPYTSQTWGEWQTNAAPVFAAAQADPSIHYIVTFGHRPAYSTGIHPGESVLATILDGFGDTYSKYVLNINGHSHDYERFQPIHGITHITTGGGGATLDPPWSSTDPRTAFRALHLEHLRVDVTSSGMRIDVICGPPTGFDDITCAEGAVIDSYTIGTAPPPPPASPTLYVDQTNTGCTDKGSGSATAPFCTISAAAAATSPGTTVQVAAGTYNEQVSVRSGTVGSPVTFTAAPGASVTVTGKLYGFYVSNKNYVTIEGFNITQTTSDAIHISSNSSNIKVIANTVSNSGQPVSNKTAKGISLANVSNVLLAYNHSHHNSNYGIYLETATNCQVVGNESAFNAKVFDRGASGIRLYASTANTISSNISHDNEDSGIESFTGSNNNLIVNNITYNNGDHGIDNFNSTGNRMLSNTVYNNVTAGINAEGGATGSTFANNISVNNGINSPRTKGNLRVDAQSVTGTTLDYDLLNVTAPNVLIDWAGTLYGGLAAFTSATGKETHGIQAAPKWVSPATGNFHLTPGSPAIDSANSGASGQTSVDADGNPRVDDLTALNSGAGPRPDDRGAYEFQYEPPPEEAPLATLAVSPASGRVNLIVSADGSGSSDSDATPIASYNFDFGDGAPPLTQASPLSSHIYTAPGTYTVTLTVTDTAGLAATSTKTVTVTDSPPTAALTVQPSSGAVGLTVTADASASTDTDATPIASYRFDFGDASPAVGPQAAATATHRYTAAGTYTVTVTVKDTGGQASTATAQVQVTSADSAPAAALTVSPASGTAPLSITADASASTDTDATPIASYRFDFGDGSAAVGPQAGATAQHTYTTPGTYTVTVTVTDTASLSSTATASVSTTDSPPTAALTVSPTSGPAPMTVTTDATASTDTDATGIASYTFEFGDGTAAVGPQPAATASHTYTAAGTYTVKVTVTDAAGLAGTKTAQVVVQTNFVRNYGFETDLSGWNTSGGGTGITLERVAGGHSGDWAAKLTNTSASASSVLLNDSPNWVIATSASTYAGTLWARADTAGATLNLRFREYSGSTLVGSATTQVKLTTTWQKVTVAYATGAAGASTLDFNAYVVSAAAGTGFYADDAAIYIP